jgi:hypothetical protein
MKWIHPVILLFGGLVLSGCTPWHTRVTPAVSGIVIDAASGKPISGATVYIEEFPKKPAVTKDDGRFSIAAIWEWQVWTATDFVGDRRPAYRLVATAKGYEDGTNNWYIGDGGPQRIKLMRAPD